MKQSREYRAAHRAADKIEPRMARAVLVAATRLRSRIPISAIEDALESGDLRLAGDILTRVDFDDAYLPSSDIIKETVIKGGKIADRDIRNG